MNPRERYIETLTFGDPDRIPLLPGWGRESTLAGWREQGLPEGVDYHEHLWELLGIEMDRPQVSRVDCGIDFRMIPQFEERILEHRNGHYVVQDWKGNVCEISDEYNVEYLREPLDFVTRRWLKCPVENRDDWDKMKLRYDVRTPGRFPEDLVERAARIKRRDYFLQINFPGPFWQLREWCGFEGLCMMMIDQPDLVAEMTQFWKDFVSAVLERMFEHFVPDAIHVNEDMAYKAKSMISPDMARGFCQPCWRTWAGQAANAGVPIVAIDSDGYIGELIPLWIEAGANVCDPVEVAAHCDINEFRRQFGRNMAYRGGVDKRCIAKGGETIGRELKRIEPVVKDGGFIPSCDHAVPPDISWPNFVEYTRLLAKMTGWL